jgi:2-dehydropantoate 2-reductase
MRIVIVGPGALGSLLAARLFLLQEKKSRTGYDHSSLHLLDYRPERAEFLHANGFLFEEGDRKVRCRPHVTADPEICTGSDLIFFCVKSTAVTSALARVTPFFTPDTLLLAMQNGISHLNEMHHVPVATGVGITSEGATLVEPGHVRHGGRGLTRLGLLSADSVDSGKKLEDIVALLNDAGMKAERTGDPLKHIWAKLFINIGINAFTAIHGCRNGELLNSPSIKETMEKAVREAVLVARAKNIPVEADPVQATFAVCEATRNNTSSMLQDVLQKRLTEIDAINGAIVAAGAEFGIPTPANAELVRQVRELEASYT